jgi:hypothetical protein
LFRLSGLFLFRLADRQLFALLFQLPPRLTRFEPGWPPPQILQHAPPKAPPADRCRRAGLRPAFDQQNKLSLRSRSMAPTLTLFLGPKRTRCPRADTYLGTWSLP